MCVLAWIWAHTFPASETLAQLPLPTLAQDFTYVRADSEFVCTWVGCSEKVVIPYNKPYIALQGAGMTATMLTNSETASMSGTADSATFTVWAPNFIARGIGFQVVKIIIHSNPEIQRFNLLLAGIITPIG